MRFKDPNWLYKYSSNVYSQTGEDGIIQKILEILPKSNKQKWCVDVGAWDGHHISNTRNLIEKEKYAAVLIEGNKKKLDSLRNNYRNYNRVFPINQFAGYSSKDNLDFILKKTPIPHDYEFLNIDIDGNDYHVWKATKKYKPKMVCIEFNPTIPNEVKFVQDPNPNICQGASLLSLVELAKEKGYELICVTCLNAFFVRSEFFPLFKIKNNDLATLRTEDHITYLFSGYDGLIFLQGYRKLPWHRITLKESKFQQIPSFLRKHPANYTIMEKALYALYILFTEPREFVSQIRKRFFKTHN